MEIIDLTQKYLFAYQNQSIVTSFALRLGKLSEIWLFNCYEGCQHVLARKNIKINHITKIIITELTIQNISGLLGLLSTFSLNSRMKQLDIYGPSGLMKYLLSGRKYSRTNFRYVLLIYVITAGLVISHNRFKSYSYSNIFTTYRFQHILIAFEQPGKFDIHKATTYKIPVSFLYNQLKRGQDFVLPDGFMVSGINFINSYFIGSKLVILHNQVNRQSCEIGRNAFLILQR